MQRTTELRHLPPELKHKISSFLDENDCWKILMSYVPKNFDCFDEKKYTNEHINIIATPRPGDSRLSAEIFLDEWATSGRKEQRPTLGTLIELLLKAEMFGIADYVAEILKEPPPQRPKSGPGARIEFQLPSAHLNGIASYVDDSAFYPNTESINLNANAQNGTSDINHDFYIKYRQDDKTYACNEAPPKPAPRSYRKSERLQMQEQAQNNSRLSEVFNPSPLTTTTTVNGSITGSQQNENTQQVTLHKSLAQNGIIEVTEENAAPSLPLLSMLQSSPKNEHEDRSSAMESFAPLPLLSAFHPDSAVADTDNLPAITALNLGGQPDDNYLDKNEQNTPLNGDLDDDDSNCIDEDEDSLRNLEGSNNDSSLTNITGTSGDNSFELSSSSASNENIPLNVLNFSR